MLTDAPRWLAVVAMVGVVLFHALRLVRAGARRRHADVADELTHTAMGLVMVVMLAGALSPADSRRLAVVFLAPLAWFAWRVLHSYVMDGAAGVGGPARQTVGCAAMVYALIVLSSAGASAAMPGMAMSAPAMSAPAVPAASLLTIALVAASVAVAAVTVVRPRVVGLPTTPALAAGCQVAMSASMVYMLVAM
jgi:hypothetical protein